LLKACKLMDRDATFNEDEIQKLLARAAELQAASDDSSSTPGLTLEEVEQAAESAGLNPRHVRQAARELSRPKTTHASTDVNDSHLFVERWIDRPMSEEVWTAVRSELRHRTGVPQGWSLSSPFEWSTTERIGDTREWTHHRLGNTRELRVSVRPSGEQTQLRLAKRTSTDGTPLLNALGIGIGLTIASASIVGGIMGSWLWALLGGVLAFGIVTPAAYAGIKAWRRSELRSLETLADQLERVLADSPSTAAASQMDRSSQGQLDDVRMESSDPSDSSPTGTRHRRREGGHS
jgi:hypothetical protein